MSDILHRLHCTIRCDIETAASGCHCAEARDEIASLRADNERLRAANETWANSYHAEYYANVRLRAALKPILNYPNIREKIGNQLYDMGCAALGFTPVPDGQPKPSGWRPIETAPKDGSRMLIAYQTSLGKWRRVIAFYASKLAVEQNDNESDWCEYDEANGRYCLPEGWHECIENWDDYSSVHMSGVEPTHWMPLPPAPGKEVK